MRTMLYTGLGTDSHGFYDDLRRGRSVPASLVETVRWMDLRFCELSDVASQKSLVSRVHQRRMHKHEAVEERDREKGRETSRWMTLVMEARKSSPR